jgi:hypothetical protein
LDLTAPLVKFVAEDTQQMWGLMAGTLPLLYYRIINAGTATHPKETAIVNWEAVEPTGQSVAITEEVQVVPRQDLRAGQAERSGCTIKFVDGRHLSDVPFRSLPMFVLWITGAPTIKVFDRTYRVGTL